MVRTYAKRPGRWPGRSCCLVELRGIEPLTFSMRTRRATNCAIAPDTGTKGYQPQHGGRNRLLPSRPRQVEMAGEGDLVQVLERGILVVDLQHCGTRPAQPGRNHVQIGVLGVLHPEP